MVTVHFNYIGDDFLNQIDFDSFTDYMEWKHDNRSFVEIVMVRENN